MKITPRQYARVLEMIIARYPNDLMQAAERFVFVLRRNHHTALFPKITRFFIEERTSDQGGGTASVCVARSLSIEEKGAIERSLLREMGNIDMHIEWKQDGAIIGGARVRIGEKGYDESVARRLRSLREHLMK